LRSRAGGRANGRVVRLSLLDQSIVTLLRIVGSFCSGLDLALERE